MDESVGFFIVDAIVGFGVVVVVVVVVGFVVVVVVTID